MIFVKNKWHKSKVFILIFSFIIFFLLYVFEKKLNTSAPLSPSSLERIEKEGEKIIAKCKSFEYKPECYDEMIPKLMDTMTMNDVFKVVSYVQKKDESYAYCHVVAHKLSFIESKRNPGTWKDIMIKCPFQMCNYGCMHGSLVEEFRGESFDGQKLEEVVEELKTVCTARNGWVPSEIEKSMCIHGLGHVVMYITEGDVASSLKICRKLITNDDKNMAKNDYKTCAGGVFMTVFQGVDPEDIALVKDIKPEKGDEERFCRLYGEDDYLACKRESLTGVDYKDPKKVELVCSYALVSREVLWDCVSMVMNDVTVTLLKNKRSDFLPNLEKYCMAMNLDFRSICFETSMLRLLQNEPFGYIEEAIGVCKVAVRLGYGDPCVLAITDFIYSGFNNLGLSSDFCKRLPDEWTDSCVELKKTDD